MKAELANHAPLVERAFANQPAEGDRWLSVEGTLPAYVRGSYYVNGPACFENGAVRYNHWLDGDGMVCALHFADDGVRFVNRFVRTTKWAKEQEAGTAVFRAFGTAFDGDQLKRNLGLESPVNVSVWPWRDTLLAFGEQGLPYELDPSTLETRGEYTFDRQLNAVSPLSAHPCFDHEAGEMFNFGISFSPRRPSLTLYRFGADGRLIYRKRMPLPYPCSVHDFGLSPRYAVFYLNPHLLDIDVFLRGRLPLNDALRWAPEEGTRLLVIDRETGTAVADLPFGDRYCLHLIDCFEKGNRLTVDLIEMNEPVYDQYTVPNLFPDVRPARPMRYLIDVEGARLVDAETLQYDRMCDFPHIDPRRAGRGYNRFWVLGISSSARPGRKFFDELVCLDWNTGGVAGRWRAEKHCYLGNEPVFIPDPQHENDGVVLVQRYDARADTSTFLVFDANDVGAGPIATLPAGSAIPPLFHATFVAS